MSMVYCIRILNAHSFSSIQYMYCTVFISGFRSRGRKRLVPKFRGVGEGNPILNIGKANCWGGGEETPPEPPEINLAVYLSLMYTYLVLNWFKVSTSRAPELNFNEWSRIHASQQGLCWALAQHISGKVTPLNHNWLHRVDQLLLIEMSPMADNEKLVP